MSKRYIPDPQFPRDKDELIRDFTVLGRLRDIRNTEWLKENLRPRWWETLLGVFQFGAALGLLVGLVQHPWLRDDSYGRLILFWFVLMILSLTFGYEFMIFRLHLLRRANGVALRQVAEMRQRLDAMEARLGEQTDAKDEEQQDEQDDEDE
jgi:hypothetical protein